MSDTMSGAVITISGASVDTHAPMPTSLTLPGTVNVGGSGRDVTFSLAAIDDQSGVKDATIFFDRPVSYVLNGNVYANGAFIFETWRDSFSDGQSSFTRTLTPYAASGTYNVTALILVDNDGNSHNYTGAELAVLGLTTSFAVTGGIADSVAPTPTSLTLPGTVDVGSSGQAATFNLSAIDDFSGVQHATIFFDRPIRYVLNNGTTASNDGLPFETWNDSFSDGLSSFTRTISPYAASGTYNVTSLFLDDNAGNWHSYTRNELAALGLTTSFTVTGGLSDAISPALTSLTLPGTVNVSGSGRDITFGLTAIDDLSGLNSAWIFFDRPISYVLDGITYSENTVSFWPWNVSLSDGQASLTQTLSPNNGLGAYNIITLTIVDNAGNSHSYAGAELAALGFTTSFRVTNNPNHQPVATVGNHSLDINEGARVANWISYSDSDANPATQYQFWDGGTASNSGYFSTSNNDHHLAGSSITVTAADFNSVWVHGGQTAGSETMWVRAFDGSDWSAWDEFTFTTTNNAPTATINDQSLHTNEWSRVASWISYSDIDGTPATQYQLWDGGTAGYSGYFWTPDNAHHPAGTEITVTASDLNNVWVRGAQAGGTETMWVRAFDGSDWSAWDSFAFTTLPNNPPVATVSDHGLQTNEWSRISTWISYSDSDGNLATQYQFWDGGAAGNSGYFWTPDNAHHPAGTEITVAASDLNNVWVRGAQAGGTETMWVRAFDGTDWGAWDSFTLTTLPNRPPVVTINDHSLTTNEWSRVSTWISYSDSDGNPATQYQFWDGGTAGNSGYFWTPDNEHHPAGGEITVAAPNLNNVWLRGGQGGSSETMWVRAFDGTDWSAWDQFNFTTLPNFGWPELLPDIRWPNTPPVTTIDDHSLHVNEWSRVSTWISYSDSDGDPAVQYQFWDGGTAGDSGYIATSDDSHHPAGTQITVAASDLDNVWIRGGQAIGTELIWVSVFDGHDWSAWDPFTLFTI